MIRLWCFSSLYIGILAATVYLGGSIFMWLYVSVPFTSGSSLQQGSIKLYPWPLAFQFPLHRDPRCNWISSRRKLRYCSFSSLYIGILAATILLLRLLPQQPRFSSLYIGILAATKTEKGEDPRKRRFSSLYIGILAATRTKIRFGIKFFEFQFPLHRDPRCNSNRNFTSPSSLSFQFPLHRDPRCNGEYRCGWE